MKKYLAIQLIFILFQCKNYAQSGFTFHAFPNTYPLTPLRFMNDFKTDSQNNLWVAYRDLGIGKYDGSAWTFYDTVNSNIPSNLVTSLSFDSLNNLWAGTSKGLTKFNGNTWTNYDSTNSGLPANYIYAVKTIGSQVYCGTNAGMVNINGTNWTTYNNQNSGIAGDSIRCIESGGVPGDVVVQLFGCFRDQS